MKLARKLISFIHGEQNIDKLLRRGLVVGENFTRMSGVIIDPSHCWHIVIGDNVTLAPNVHILAHDASTKLFLNHTRVCNVKIGNNVFIGASSIILPGVTIGDNVVVGAGSIVTKDIPSNSVVAGNPAQVINSLENFLNKKKNEQNSDNTFDENFTLRNPHWGEEQRKTLLKACSRYGTIYLE